MKELTSVRKSPHTLECAELSEFADVISHTAPITPKATPAHFKIVIGSFKIKAANIITKMGVEVTITEASTGEVVLRPSMNRYWFTAIPQRPQIMSLNMSIMGTFWRSTKIEAIQNTEPAMNILSIVCKDASNFSDRSHFEIGVFSPNIKFAVSMSRCPCILSLVTRI